MLDRIARAWLRLLLAVGLALLGGSLLLNVMVLCLVDIGDAWKPVGYGILFLGAATAPFIRESWRWMDQIKACPRWMWVTAIGVAIYGLAAAFLQFTFPVGSHFEDQTLAFSAFPLGFEAIDICILYTALRTNFLERTSLPRCAGFSLGLIALTCLMFIAVREGWLPHPARSPYPG
jgi:hypothetical protein